MIMVGSGENARGIDLGNGLTLRFGRKPQSARNPSRHLNSDEGYSCDFTAHQAGSRPEAVNLEEGIQGAGGKMRVWTWEELEDESHFEEDAFSVKESILQPLHHSTVVPRKSRSRLNDFQAQDTRYVCARACVCVRVCARECVPVCVPACLRLLIRMSASTQRGGDALVNVCACRIKCNTATRRAVTYRQLRRFDRDLCDLLRNENDMKCVVYLYKHRGRIRRAMVRSCDVF
jgi:hypothetical protein